MTVGRVLYDNVFNKDGWDGITYTGAEVSGFEKEHAFDYYSFTDFRLASGSSSLSVDNSTGEAYGVDYIIIFHAKFSSGTFSFDLRDAGGAFVSSQSLDGSKNIEMFTFTEEAIANGDTLYVDFTASTALDITQIFLGKMLKLSVIDGTKEPGQWQGIAPPTLPGAVQPQNTFSVNGQFLGQSTRAQFREGDIEIENVAQSWVRSSWVPFQEHAVNKSWFYAWNYDDYPDEIVMCVTPNGQIQPAENTNPGGPYMSVSMPFVAIKE